MIGFSDIVDDFVFGEYNLKDLVNFNDLLMILLKMMVVRGVLWEISNILNIFGNFVFLFDFNGVIEVEIVINELLVYYQCLFVDRKLDRVYFFYCYVV